MDFKEILAKVYRMRRTDKVLSDPIVLAGRMYDLCQNEYETKKKIDLFYKLDTKVHFFPSIIDNDGTVEPLFARYRDIAEFISEDSFHVLVMIVKEIMDKNGECYYPRGKQSTKIKPKQIPQQYVQPINTNQQQASQLKQTTDSSSTMNSVDVVVGCGIILAILVVITGIVLLCVFGKRIEWWQWQHIIGAFSGAIITGITIGIGWLFASDSSEGVMTYIVAAIISSVVNIPLVFVYKEQYSIIFYWISAYQLLWAIIMAFYTYLDYEKGATIVCVLAALAIAVALSTYIGLHFTKFCESTSSNMPITIETIIEESEVIEEVESIVETNSEITIDVKPVDEQNISEESKKDVDNEQMQEETMEDNNRMVAGWAWWKWQHLIGAIGGLLISAAFIFLSFLFMDEELYYWTPFTFGALLIANLGLLFLYKSDYYVVSYWVSGYIILASMVSSFMAFDDIEDGFGIASIVEIILSIVLIVLVAVLSKI